RAGVEEAVAGAAGQGVAAGAAAQRIGDAAAEDAVVAGGAGQGQRIEGGGGAAEGQIVAAEERTAVDDEAAVVGRGAQRQLVAVAGRELDVLDARDVGPEGEALGVIAVEDERVVAVAA